MKTAIILAIGLTAFNPSAQAQSFFERAVGVCDRVEIPAVYSMSICVIAAQSLKKQLNDTSWNGTRFAEDMALYCLERSITSTSTTGRGFAVPAMSTNCLSGALITLIRLRTNNYISSKCYLNPSPQTCIPGAVSQPAPYVAPNPASALPGASTTTPN